MGSTGQNIKPIQVPLRNCSLTHSSSPSSYSTNSVKALINATTQGTVADDKNLVRIVFNDKQYWSIDATHAPVESIETETVVLRTVQQAPWTALCTCRQVIAQLHIQTDKHLQKLFLTTNNNI